MSLNFPNRRLISLKINRFFRSERWKNLLIFLLFLLFAFILRWLQYTKSFERQTEEQERQNIPAETQH